MSTNTDGWVGVDLDRTLAYYTQGDFTSRGPYFIGEPILPMVKRVKRWLSEGIDVRIMTARITGHGANTLTYVAINAWCFEHIGQLLPITNTKDFEMRELWDDRAVQVIGNTGQPVGTSPSGLSE